MSNLDSVQDIYKAAKARELAARRGGHQERGS